LAVEVAWLRAAELPKLIGVEALLAGETLSPPAAPPAPAPARESAPLPRSRPEPEAAAAPPSVEAPAVVFDPRYESLLEAVSRSRPALAARLRQVRDARWEEEDLVLWVDPSDRELADGIRRPANSQVLEEALRQQGSASGRYRIEHRTPSPPPRATVATVADSSGAAAAERHPTVQTLLQIFDGAVAEVVPSAGRGESR
jgi:hypothetical protein